MIDSSTLQSLPPSPLQPVSFSTLDRGEELLSATTCTTTIWARPSTSLYFEKDLLQVNRGESIIPAHKYTTVIVGDVKVLMDKHSTAQIIPYKNSIIVRCLYDERSGAVKIGMGTNHFELQAGQEFIIGDENQSLSAYRNRRELRSSKGKAVIRDFSLLSLFRNGELLLHVKHGKGSFQNSLLPKIEKRFVCAQLLHPSKEPFAKR